MPEPARDRGWHRLRLLSAGDSTFKYDLGSEDEAGNQHSTISVFTRDASGAVRHHYAAHPNLAEDIHERGLDLLMPVWHVLDLTRQGRGNWYAGAVVPGGGAGLADDQQANAQTSPMSVSPARDT